MKMKENEKNSNRKHRTYHIIIQHTETDMLQVQKLFSYGTKHNSEHLLLNHANRG